MRHIVAGAAPVATPFGSGCATPHTRFTFREDAYVEERVEILPNLETSEDCRVNAKANDVAPLSRLLAIQLGYGVRFDDLPKLRR